MASWSGERAACVTGAAAGEGEGRSASAPAKRRACRMGALGPIDGAWRLRVETGKPKRMIALCVGSVG
jgi:hypothetical protein